MAKVSIKDLPPEELFYGHAGCAGCGGTLAARLALKILGEKTIMVIPPCCVMAVSCFYPQIPFRIPALISSFPGTAAVLSGVSAGLRVKNKEGYNVVGFAGDGGTADIGLQALSGAVERGDKFIYICYDNEAYMNTGAQRSGATPSGARTTTTPITHLGSGESQPKKDMFRIMVAHDIPYAATASIAYPADYFEKLNKAIKTEGPSYIHVLAPCPTGWGFDSNMTVKAARLAVDTGLWPLMEYEGRQVHLTKKPATRKPVSSYFKIQNRFRHLTPEDISLVQQRVDQYWTKILNQKESLLSGRPLF